MTRRAMIVAAAVACLVVMQVDTQAGHRRCGRDRGHRHHSACCQPCSYTTCCTTSYSACPTGACGSACDAGACGSACGAGACGSAACCAPQATCCQASCAPCGYSACGSSCSSCGYSSCGACGACGDAGVVPAGGQAAPAVEDAPAPPADLPPTA